MWFKEMPTYNVLIVLCDPCSISDVCIVLSESFIWNIQTSMRSVHRFNAIFTMYAICVFSSAFSSLQWRIL